MGNKKLTRQNELIITKQVGDVTGDGMPDTVFLTGKKSEFLTNFIENIAVNVQNGRTGKIVRIPLKVNEGYNPKLFLGDFTNNGTLDILVGIPTGGTGGFVYYYLLSFYGNNFRYLFDPEKINQGLKFDVNYRDNYKVDVSSKELGRNFVIDVSSKKDMYEQSKIYNKKGKLIRPYKGFVNALSSLVPVRNPDGSYNLQSLQRITGIANADTLGYVQGTWKYENGMLRLQNVTVVL